MDQIKHDIIEFSDEYTKSKNREYLKQYGQFFTLSNVLIENLLDKRTEFTEILEPSCGSGMIILTCLEKLSKCNIDAIEIDVDIYKKTTQIFKDYNNINVINSDFLKYNFKKKYDLVIGNPPYFELNKEQKDLYRDEFSEIYNGKTNIYGLCIYKSIKLLKDKGQLIFIIPKTILSSISFSKLRDFINKHCNILDIIKFDNTNLFKGALQSVVILKLQKVDNPNNNFKIYINNNLFFVKNKQNLSLFKDSTTIFKLGCNVKTGSIVWNKYKQLLEDTKNIANEKLIFSENINFNKLVLKEKKNKTKKQYLKINDNNKKLIITGPYIIINRIVSNGKLNIFFEKLDSIDTRCFIENHVNYILGPLDKLEQIYFSLICYDTHIFLKEFISNTQVSQKELQYIIPIFIKN